MHKTMLPVALATILAAGMPAAAATLFSENFDAVPVGNYQLGNRVGQFTVARNDVDIFGQPANFYACPAPNSAGGNYCLDLNGNANGRIETDALALAGGTTYTVSFKLAGNGTPFSPAPTSPYSLNVSFAGVTRAFEVAPAAPFQTISFDVLAGFDGTSILALESTSPNQPSYWGAIIDDVSITSPDTTAVPEPASWAMMVAGFGLLGASMRRGRRGGDIAIA